MPQSLGHALSIVGGLVVGQAAVEARIVSAPMLIIVALSGISGLMVPRLKGAVFYLRLIYVVLSALFGLYGYIAGITLDRASFQSLKDSFWRAPWGKMRTRPFFNQNIIRAGEKEK